MFYIAICDDEPAFLDFLSNGIRQLMSERGNEQYEIHQYTHPGALMDKVAAGTRYHILFQDILLGDENGIETAKRLRDAHEANSSIIFVSSQPQFAVNTFLVGPSNFLTKPIGLDDLRRALTASLQKWETETTILLVDVNGAKHYACFADINYVEVYQKDAIFHEMGGKQIVCSNSDELLNMLPYPRFCRCHRNYVANMGNVYDLEPDGDLRLKDGTTLPVSRRRYDQTEIAFGKHLEVMP